MILRPLVTVPVPQDFEAEIVPKLTAKDAVIVVAVQVRW